MRGYLLRTSFATPQVQKNLESFGRVCHQAKGPIEQPYYNGLGRTVPQLARMTLKFCKHGGTSKGLRDFIEEGLIDFTRSNPGVVVYLKPRLHKTAVMVCEYLNGSYHWQNLHKMNKNEIENWINFAATRSGDEIKSFEKNIRTEWPSLQGPWNPFLNKPTELNLSQFPNEERGRFISEKPSATEQLLQLQKTIQNLN